MRHPALLILTLVSSSPDLFADQILLKNGDRLSGTVINQQADSVTIVHQLFGELVIPQDQLADQPVSTTIQKSDPPTLAKVRKPDSVKRRIEAGLNGANGNSRNSDWRIGFQQRGESKSSKHLFESSYRRASSDGNTEENDFFAQLTYDWLLPESRWMRFTRARYDWDEFEDWDSRISGAAGYGYRFKTSGNLSLSGRSGLGATQTFGGSDDDIELEILVGVDGEWKVNGRQRLEFANTFYQGLEELSHFRNLSSLAWIVRLDQLNGIDLKLGLENEYETPSPGDSRSNDFKYDVSLTWQLR